MCSAHEKRLKSERARYHCEWRAASRFGTWLRCIFDEALRGASPDAYTSQVAPVKQGAYSAPGGAQQVLVPNRSQWTDPAKVSEIKDQRWLAVMRKRF